MKLNNRILLLLIFLYSTSWAQPKESSIDSLFSEWDNAQNPGMAAAVLYQGKIAYRKGFGIADLTTRAPITPDTKFQVAGLSKHFTAFAILLLEEQGKLSLDDDIRKYVPQLRDFGKTITIEHLLTQSSGLYEYWATKQLAGWRADDVFTHEDALALINRQKELTFDPGTDFTYINSGLTLLVEVVAKVSGQSFSTYVKENLFDPLQMYNTVFVEDHKQLLTHAAMPYEASDNGFKKSVVNYGNAGPTNLYTSVNDLCRWEMNLRSPKVGSKALIKTLDTPVALKNGRTFNSSSGTATLGQQFIHKERGIHEIYQTGSLGGYASSIFKFPNQDFAVIVLSNNGMPYSGFLGMQSAYLFLENNFAEPATIDFSKMDIKKLSTKALKSYSGHYWDNEAGFSRRIYLKEDTLRYDRGGGRESAILPLDNNTFQMVVDWDDKVIIDFEKREGKQFMLFRSGDSDPYVMEAYQKIAYSADELKQFTGSFYCEELNATYQLDVKEGKLTASSLRNADITFEPITKDLFSGNQWIFGGVSFERGQNNEIANFKLTIDEVKGLQFRKIGNISKRNL